MHYEVSGSADEVAAWSESRLQFQPHSWQKEYRQALRTALGKLVASPEQGLLARYLAPNDDFVDVENVLLYNIGTGLFAPLIRGGITCRRDARPEALHNLTYRVVDSPPDPGGGAVVGRVTSDLTTGPPRTVGRWWAQLRSSLSSDAHSGGPSHPPLDAFTLDVELRGPQAPQALPGLLKPLLDGLVACFHVHDGSNERLLRSRLVDRTGLDDAWPLVLREDAAILGTRTLTRPSGQGIVWNPADDRCQAFRVIPRTAPQWSITCELRAANQAAESIG